MVSTWGALPVAVSAQTDSESRIAASLVDDALPPIDERVEVSFRYRVLFTEHVFALDNPLLAQSLANSQAATPTKFL